MDTRTGMRLASLRKERGYSQEALAAELGLTRQAISKWERGESSPDTENLLALADLYGMTLDELIRGEGATAVAGRRMGEPAVLDSFGAAGISDPTKADPNDAGSSATDHSECASSESRTPRTASDVALAESASLKGATSMGTSAGKQDGATQIPPIPTTPMAQVDVPVVPAAMDAEPAAVQETTPAPDPADEAKLAALRAEIAAMEAQKSAGRAEAAQTSARAAARTAMAAETQARAGGGTSSWTGSASGSRTGSTPRSGAYSIGAILGMLFSAARKGLKTLGTAVVEFLGTHGATFPYPMFCSLFYLLVGILFGAWHPGWIIFFTIPFYYWAVGVVGGDPAYRDRGGDTERKGRRR